MPANDKTHKGERGETIARGFLEGLGFVILESRYRCVFGEIDIIAKDEGYTVFVEVKYRKSLKAGLPAEAVTKRKQESLINTALFYIGEKNIVGDFRFDVIEVFGNELIDILHHKNAFYCE